MDKQFFTDLKNNDVGLLENALPMVTGAIAEPVAGIAAMYHAATGGHDASGVVNAIRDAMTYQPRTDAGKMYQQALGSAVNRIVQSAPVRTWQKGVDIAGQYSPTAGAVLQTVPAAIGAATGIKSGLQAGRAVSGLLDRVESFAPTKPAGAMVGAQTGMVDPTIFGHEKKKLTEYELAHAIAQRNAALPVDQGGLGLPKNNTAMDRARAMGFMTGMPMYHGTSADVHAFDLGRGGEVSGSPVGKLGVSLVDSNHIHIADEFSRLPGSPGDGSGPNVLRLLHRAENPASMDIPHKAKNKEMAGAVLDAWDEGHDALRMRNYITPGGITDGTMYLIKDPSQLRLNNAAFDPMRITSDDLLAANQINSADIA